MTTPLRRTERAQPDKVNMISRVWFWAAALLLVLSTQTASATDNNVFGYWKRVDDKTGQTLSIFRLWEDKGKLVGRIVKVFPKPGEKPPICNDCAGAAKDKPVKGLIFLWGFTRDDEQANKWVDGKVLNPENGKTYGCEVELLPDGKGLKVYGYVSFLVKLGGSSVWQRPTAAELQGI
jgi:uncharacterized protein (DUF2147 family)